MIQQFEITLQPKSHGFDYRIYFLINVIAPEGLETETWYLAASSYNKGTIAGQEIKIGIDGTDIYMQGICYALPKAWIKGTIDAETNIATFATGQFFGKAAVEDEWGEETTCNLFFVGHGNGIEDMEFVIDNEAGLMITDQVIVLNKKRMTINFIDYFTNVIISKDYYGPVTAPDGLETETYLFKAVASKNGVEEVDEDYSAQVEVGFDGDDVYIKGISIDCLDFWVKATKNEAGKYVIPANQYMGTLDIWGYLFYDYYFTAIDEDGNFEDIVLSYNPETSTFTSNQTLVLNGSNKDLDPYYTFNNVTITKMDDLAATPADPIIKSYDFEKETGYNNIRASIPTVDVDGNDLLTSKLFYTIWFEKDGVKQPYTFTFDLYCNDFEENLTEIPYNHEGYDIYPGGEVIFLEDESYELATWTNVGIQTIYYGGGECNKSNIVWFNPETTAIAEVKTGSKNAVIFDLQGRRVAKTAKGLYIMDGKKVVVK